MVKFLAVVASIGGSKGESAASRPRISTAVTMFVFTPVMIWTFTQSWPLRWTPYFSSYHFTKRLVLNPVESGAKSTSTAFKGRLERMTRSRKIGVMSGL